MKTRIAKLLPMLIALACCATAVPPSIAVEPAASASEENSNQAVMARWQEARKKYDTLAGSFKNDPAKAKLVADFSRLLDEAGTSLNEVLEVTSAAAPDAKKTATALNTLKTKIKALGVQQAKLKSDKALADSSTSLINLLGGALSQRQQATKSAVSNLR